MSEVRHAKKDPFYYWSNKDLRGRKLDFDQKWWLGTQLFLKLMTIEMLIETYHLSRRTFLRYEKVVKMNGKFGGKRRETPPLSEEDKLFIARLARKSGVSPDDPSPAIQRILKNALDDSKNIVQQLI